MKGYQGAVLGVMLVWAIGAASAQTANLGEAVETKSSGSINWTTGEVYATGIGAPPAQPVNAAQARAMAERAAVVVAYRNLLEIVKGVQVDSETLVENLIAKNDVIRTRVDGIVKGARILKIRHLPDGSVEALVVMPMKGAFLGAVVPEDFGSQALPLPPSRPLPLPQRPSDIRPAPVMPQPAPPAPPAPPTVPEKKTEPMKPAPPLPAPEKKAEPTMPQPLPAPSPGSSTVQFKGGVATGIVIDGRGTGLRPALLPKIVDPQGREIYVGQVVTRTNAVEQGVAGYAKDVNAAANNFRVTDNPAVIKATQASGAARTDVMLSQADAQALRELGNRGDFLQYCRVIIVY